MFLIIIVVLQSMLSRMF